MQFVSKQTTLKQKPASIQIKRKLIAPLISGLVVTSNLLSIKLVHANEKDTKTTSAKKRFLIPKGEMGKAFTSFALTTGVLISVYTKMVFTINAYD